MSGFIASISGRRGMWREGRGREREGRRREEGGKAMNRM